MAKKSKGQLWAKVEARIAEGDFPPVFVAADGRLCLDGQAATLPDRIAKLYPAEILAAAERKAADHRAAQAAEYQRWEAERKAADDRREEIRRQYGSRRVWRLAGLFIDDLSTARYTLDEIEAWIDWDACNLRHKQPEVKVVAETDDGEFWMDFSAHFDDVCNESRGTPSFEKLATRLRGYTNNRKQRAAGSN